MCKIRGSLGSSSGQFGENIFRRFNVSLKTLTLHVSYEHTHRSTEYKILQERRYESERHAEHGEQQVADAQIEKEHVRDGAHPSVLNQSDDHQRISDDGQ